MSPHRPSSPCHFAAGPWTAIQAAMVWEAEPGRSPRAGTPCNPVHSAGSVSEVVSVPTPAIYASPIYGRARRGPHPVPCVTAGPSAFRGPLRAGRTPGPGARHLMSPPSAFCLAIVATPRPARRDGGLCPRRSLPALRRVGSPPPPLCPPSTSPDPSLTGGRKSLSPVPQIGYNSHSPQASCSFQPVLRGGLASAVVGLFREGPAGEKLIRSALVEP
jgi:hypothetical protein